ncbi:hypothetical protein RJT34_01015 [Clitoria ternatea]|uniref:Uncharacterized protein n=1 Tax=Clitoria ternatea TaxID=43366 RepID=A0AAN9KHB7_CLITE
MGIQIYSFIKFGLFFHGQREQFSFFLFYFILTTSNGIFVVSYTLQKERKLSRRLNWRTIDDNLEHFVSRVYAWYIWLQCNCFCFVQYYTYPIFQLCGCTLLRPAYMGRSSLLHKFLV